jgi:UDP-glucose 4-epimerase
MEAMNILVIGSNGFIGSHVSMFLKSKGYRVVEADIISTNAHTFILQPDLSNLAQLFTSQQFDCCINASGSSTVSYSIAHEAQDLVLNYNNVAAILSCIKNYQPSCRLINLSSAAVYGNPTRLPVRETDNTQPISPYGKHKLMSEQLLQKYHKEFGILTLSLRIFSVYGNGLKKQLFWDIYRKSRSSQVITLYGTGAETRDFIHIEDLMQVFEKVLDKAVFNGDAINVASGKSYSINEAATSLLTYLGDDFKIAFNGVQQASDPLYWLADISRLSELGFCPNITLERGLQQYALWLKELN